jgi:hypothetical protein
VRKTLTMDAHPQSAIPPFEPPLLPAMINESGRRILWIVGVYRAVCGTLLVGTALFLDMPAAGIGLPSAFLSASGLYFIFGLASFLWVQRESLVRHLPMCVAARQGRYIHRVVDVRRRQRWGRWRSCCSRSSRRAAG